MDLSCLSLLKLMVCSAACGNTEEDCEYRFGVERDCAVAGTKRAPDELDSGAVCQVPAELLRRRRKRLEGINTRTGKGVRRRAGKLADVGAAIDYRHHLRSHLPQPQHHPVGRQRWRAPEAGAQTPGQSQGLDHA